MWLGNEWSVLSESFMPPPVLPGFVGAAGINSYLRSSEEQEAYDGGKSDAFQCPYCGQIVESRYIPIIMQTNFKRENPPFLEEIQREIRITIENARHIIFFGYRLPPDDFIYKSHFAARKKKSEKPFFSLVIGVDKSAPNEWLSGDKLDNYIKDNPGQDIRATVKLIKELFDKPGIRAYMRGIPDVFLNGDSGDSNTVCKERVRDLLYPEAVFPKGWVERNNNV